MTLAEPLTVYHFSGELRKPTIKIAARDIWSACAHFAKKMGYEARPRQEVPFDPALHSRVELAEADFEAMAEYPMEAFFESYKGNRTKYGKADPDYYPLLNYFGRGGITPEWVIDRRTGEVRIAGEFESFPRYFLNLKGKPTREMLLKSGGRWNVGGEFDLLASSLSGIYPWLQIEDGEDLKNRLLDEIDQYERQYS